MIGRLFHLKFSHLKLSLLFVLAFLGACASNPMEVAGNQDLVKPPATQAQVVFMRHSFVGSAISASVYEVSDDEITFIGVLNNDTKLVHSTEPGEHVFMVVSEAADFMVAELDGGKTYYSIATPRMGAWKARFSLWPIKKDPGAQFHVGSEEFSQWLRSTTLVENTDEAMAWYETNKASVRGKYEKYWPVWNEKTPEDLLQRTLSTTDGL